MKTFNERINQADSTYEASRIVQEALTFYSKRFQTLFDETSYDDYPFLIAAGEICFNLLKKENSHLCEAVDFLASATNGTLVRIDPNKIKKEDN